MSFMTDSQAAAPWQHWAVLALRILLAAFFVYVAARNLYGDEAMASDFETSRAARPAGALGRTTSSAS